MCIPRSSPNSPTLIPPPEPNTVVVREGETDESGGGVWAELVYRNGWKPPKIDLPKIDSRNICVPSGQQWRGGAVATATAAHSSSVHPTVIDTTRFEQLVSPAPGETSLYIVTQIQHKSHIRTIVYSDTVPPTRAGFEYAHSVKTRHTVPPSGPFSPVWR